MEFSTIGSRAEGFKGEAWDERMGKDSVQEFGETVEEVLGQEQLEGAAGSCSRALKRLGRSKSQL